jgi:hypothetical protein
MSPILIGWLLVAGCSQSTPPETKAAAIKAIAERCGLPKGAIRLIGEDELRFQPPADAKYAAVDCALAELKKLKFPLKMGFVGHEVFAPEAK